LAERRLNQPPSKFQAEKEKERTRCALFFCMRMKKDRASQCLKGHLMGILCRDRCFRKNAFFDAATIE
jgi:hypothetical protein